jgi:hypothetical protein
VRMALCAARPRKHLWCGRAGMICVSANAPGLPGRDPANSLSGDFPRRISKTRRWRTTARIGCPHRGFVPAYRCNRRRAAHLRAAASQAPRSASKSDGSDSESRPVGRPVSASAHTELRPAGLASASLRFLLSSPSLSLLSATHRLVDAAKQSLSVLPDASSGCVVGLANDSCFCRSEQYPRTTRST